MNVVIVGGHGKIGMRLAKLLADRGDSPRGIIRKTEQAADLEASAPSRSCSTSRTSTTSQTLLAGSDAVVFAAGAGPGSGPARKRTVDYGGAVKLVDAAKAQGITR